MPSSTTVGIAPGPAAHHRQPGSPSLSNVSPKRFIPRRRREHIERRQHVALAVMLKVKEEANTRPPGRRQQANRLVNRWKE